MALVALHEVSKVYPKDGTEVHALEGATIAIDAGELVLVRGPSGSGKSTLLLSLGAMVRPTSGRVLWEDRDVYALSGRARDRLRAREIGFVFQVFHLIPYLNVLENVLTPQLAGAPGADRDRARELIQRFGLGDRISHRPAELSVGERQRVALARALITRPRLILADEPTGNLDPENAAQVIACLAEFHAGGGTVVVVTHEDAARVPGARVVSIRDGRIGEPETSRVQDGSVEGER